MRVARIGLRWVLDGTTSVCVCVSYNKYKPKISRFWLNNQLNLTRTREKNGRKMQISLPAISISELLFLLEWSMLSGDGNGSIHIHMATLYILEQIVYGNGIFVRLVQKIK